ncbi:MAG: sigma-70 family RNA polymerase sigma factor [Armatimonadota bacterium]
MPTRGADAQLVTATLGGDQAAFGELVARYKDAVFGVAFHRLGDFEEARDVAQEAFVKAYLNLPKLRDGAAFSHWLYRIADGTAVDALRRRRGELSLDSSDAFEAGTGRLQPAPGGLKPAATPAAADAVVAHQVREALSQLTEADRLAVVLHYVNGYSHAEVAQFLGTTAGAVKTRVSRAKAKLREEMAEMVERKLKQDAAVFYFEATDASGRVVIGETSDAESATAVRRRLAQRGYRVTVARRKQPPGTDREVEDCEPIKRVATFILGQALKDNTSRIAIALASRPAECPLAVRYLVGGSWHEVMRMASYVWSPLREQFAGMAGTSLPSDGTRQSGVIRFQIGDEERVFRATFYKRTVRLDVVP